MKNLFCYTDVASGDSFARTGGAKPRAGTGNGGAKGIGGTQGRRHKEKSYDLGGNPSGSYWEIDAYPGIGTNGKSGVLGCVVIYYEK